MNSIHKFTHFKPRLEIRSPEVVRSLRRKITSIAPHILGDFDRFADELAVGIPWDEQFVAKSESEANFLEQIVRHKGLRIQFRDETNMVSISVCPHKLNISFSDAHHVGLWIRPSISVIREKEKVSLFDISTGCRAEITGSRWHRAYAEIGQNSFLLSADAFELQRILFGFGFLNEESMSTEIMADFESTFHYRTRYDFSIQPKESDSEHVPLDFENLGLGVGGSSIRVQDGVDCEYDQTFTNVILNRKSTRKGSGQKIEEKRLMRLLASLFKNSRGLHSYPSAGGAYELKCFLIVENCENIERGLYYVSSEKKLIVPLKHNAALLDAVFHDASLALGASPSRPDALLVFASNLGQLKKLYGDLAYRLTLLNAGVLLGHIYNYASYLDIGVCAIGTQDSRFFSQISGADPVGLPSVVELALFG